MYRQKINACILQINRGIRLQLRAGDCWLQLNSLILKWVSWGKGVIYTNVKPSKHGQLKDFLISFGHYAMWRINSLRGDECQNVFDRIFWKLIYIIGGNNKNETTHQITHELKYISPHFVCLILFNFETCLIPEIVFD